MDLSTNKMSARPITWAVVIVVEPFGFQSKWAKIPTHIKDRAKKKKDKNSQNKEKKKERKLQKSWCPDLASPNIGIGQP